MKRNHEWLHKKVLRLVALGCSQRSVYNGAKAKIEKWNAEIDKIEAEILKAINRRGDKRT